MVNKTGMVNAHKDITVYWKRSRPFKETNKQLI